MEYLALVLWCFLVALGGGLVGLVLGNIRLPVVLLLASSLAAGAGTNIAISGLAAATAGAAHIRAGRINWRLFGWMAPPSIAGAMVGGYVSGLLPGDALLAIIGSVAWAMTLFGDENTPWAVSERVEHAAAGRLAHNVRATSVDHAEGKEWLGFDATRDVDWEAEFHRAVCQTLTFFGHNESDAGRPRSLH